MPAPDDIATASPAPTNVVPLRIALSDALAVATRMQENYRQSCLNVVACRIEWLASGVSCWPDALITREHMLTQLRILADGVRRIGEPDQPSAPAPTGGDAA